jgi:hypothetical protein
LLILVRVLTIIDPHLKPEFTGDKTSILDVKIRHPSGAIINVEIQVKVDQYLRKRAAFTTAKMIAEQLKRGRSISGPAGGQYRHLRGNRAFRGMELAMAAQTDPVIKDAVRLVMEVNEDEVERARADSRLKWQMDQAARERTSYNKGLVEGLAEGRKEAEAAYRSIKREVTELRRKLREAGIDN